ncbi:MAG: RNA-directed DNA polymerase [Hydrogenophaga sp.]|uniref:RNA-directed DNA polymerase n=1 Tax=Hydrogenophaga sp. TaxID=1904254 RepID=UPI001D7A5C7A|nr:RNA-directed DNA polymerase [Hydrogenophaga sp.]MBX3611308.1 RNA-directed DNA polymerase [Hydrogenophaga sp.]
MKRLLSNGYFPAELPPPFHTKTYAHFLTANTPAAPFALSNDREPNYISRPVSYNLARAGTLRRQLDIPNPINFFMLASVIEAMWPALTAKWYSKPGQALSKPKKTTSGQAKRAYEWAGSFSDIPEHRARIRAGMRYGLQTDIKGFYPSIYTHSIPWALHGKEKSQEKIGWAKLRGNKIDRLLQIGQLKQTKGIPIGPDTSFLVAEMLLTKLDRQIVGEVGSRYFRYLDDFEFAFATFNEAEKGLSRFQEILGQFELIANEAKTCIFELPAPLDGSWPREIRNMALTGSTKMALQKTLLVDLFNRSVELRLECPDQGIIVYAVRKTAGFIVAQNNWRLYQQLLFQWAQAEPAVLPVVLDILSTYRDAGYLIDLDGLSELLHMTIQLHALRGHTSEVAWALWGHLLFDLPLQTSASTTVRRIDNSIVALLALDARARKLVAKTASIDVWKKHMSPDSLVGEQWLLAYEGRVKKWVPPLSTKEYVRTAPGFGVLANGNVSFYDSTCASTYRPKSMELLRMRLKLISEEADEY